MTVRCRTTDRLRAPFSFQRLLIVHRDLVRICTGRELDEGASLEEQSEHILFYYNESHRSEGIEDAGSLGENSHATVEAVQFAGLCSALYSLPSSLAHSAENDYAGHVHFGRSTLVFIQLEHSVLAVAQIPRRSSRGVGSDAHIGDGNTLAVQSSIKRCHDFFCMMRGGGIQHRISMLDKSVRTAEGVPSEDSLKDEQSDQDQTMRTNHPGMSTLFSLRRRKRCQMKTLSRGSTTIDPKQATANENEIKNIDKEIQVLLCSLPIQSVRKDLRIHYEEFLSDKEAVESSGWVSSCCIVEHVPLPGLSSFPHHLEEPSLSDLLTSSLMQLLQETAYRHGDDAPALIGGSCFYNGVLINSHTSPYISTHNDNEKFAETNKDTFHIIIEPEQANMVYGYMSSLRTKVGQSAAALGGVTYPTSPAPLNHTARSRQPPDCSPNKEKAANPCPGGFVEPPPLSMLSASDQIFQVVVPSLGHAAAWTPRIHLPFANVGVQHNYRHRFTETHVALYEVNSFGILLFLKPGVPTSKCLLSKDESSQTRISKVEDCTEGRHVSVREVVDPEPHGACSISSASALLEFASRHLSSCLNAVLNDERNADVEKGVPSSISADNGMNPMLHEQGQDIVFVDRKTQKLTLITSRESVPKPSNGPAWEHKTSRISISLFGVKGTAGQPKVLKASDAPHGKLPPAKIDCRHVLASQLPLGVILAFDDMMNEVYNLSYCKGQPHGGSAKFGDSRSKVPVHAPRKLQDGALEVCTFLQHGWMYAHVYDEKELYILFDANACVTIADIQNRVVHIHRQLMHESS